MIPKFRAWLKNDREMIDADEIHWDDGHLDFIGDGITFMRKADEVILMQSTGLFDKSGKEIFEGDIVKTTRFFGRADEVGGFYEYDKELIGIVKVLEGAWVIDTGNDAVPLWTEIEENEVVGNIHEQPELLTKIYNLQGGVK